MPTDMSKYLVKAGLFARLFELAGLFLVLEGENGPGLLLRQDHQTSWSLSELSSVH